MSLWLYNIVNKYCIHQLCCVTNNSPKSQRLTTKNIFFFFPQGLQVCTVSHDFLFWNPGWRNSPFSGAGCFHGRGQTGKRASWSVPPPSKPVLDIWMSRCSLSSGQSDSCCQAWPWGWEPHPFAQEVGQWWGSMILSLGMNGCQRQKNSPPSYP